MRPFAMLHSGWMLSYHSTNSSWLLFASCSPRRTPSANVRHSTATCRVASPPCSRTFSWPASSAYSSASGGSCSLRALLRQTA